MDLLGVALWVVSPEDLILSKLHWARESHSDFQLRDVRNILRSLPPMDWEYLERWAADLGVKALLEEVGSAVVKDSTARAEEMLQKLTAQRSPDERVRMSASMFDAARYAVIAGLRSLSPGLSEVELRAQVFLRTYAADLPEQRIQQVLARIRGAPG